MDIVTEKQIVRAMSHMIRENISRAINWFVLRPRLHLSLSVMTTVLGLIANGFILYSDYRVIHVVWPFFNGWMTFGAVWCCLIVFTTCLTNIIKLFVYLSCLFECFYS